VARRVRVPLESSCLLAARRLARVRLPETVFRRVAADNQRGWPFPSTQERKSVRGGPIGRVDGRSLAVQWRPLGLVWARGEWRVFHEAREQQLGATSTDRPRPHRAPLRRILLRHLEEHHLARTSGSQMMTSIISWPNVASGPHDPTGDDIGPPGRADTCCCGPACVRQTILARRLSVVAAIQLRTVGRSSGAEGLPIERVGRRQSRLLRSGAGRHMLMHQAHCTVQRARNTQCSALQCSGVHCGLQSIAECSAAPLELCRHNKSTDTNGRKSFRSSPPTLAGNAKASPFLSHLLLPPGPGK